MTHAVRHQRTPPIHRWCDLATGGLLCALAVFSPWAFGSTQEWAVWTMNGGEYLLGGLWLTKLLVRWRTGYSPARWGGAQRRWPVVLLAVLTVLLLAWCLVSAVNARATYVWAELQFEYREHYVDWLPHSYDAPRSWFAFWTYLGLGLTFWAARDWLLGKTRRERYAASGAGGEEDPTPAGSPGGGVSDLLSLARLPARLRVLLWVLCLNGALLGVEGILQRFDGTNKLLWLVKPRINDIPETQFGPYAYRGNASQYFNLLWPLCLGFWWSLHREASTRIRSRWGEGPHLLLLPCVVVMAVCPFVATTRGGALVAAGNLFLALIVLIFASRRENPRAVWSFLAAFVVLAALIGYLGWESLYNRVSAPTFTYSTGQNAELEEVTLRCVFQAPVENPKQTAGLVGVSASKFRLDGNPHSLWVAVGRDGDLDVRFFGDEGTNYVRKTVPGFVSAHGGQRIDLRLVKTTNLLLFLNGVEVPTVDASYGSEQILTNKTSVAYLWVGRLYPGFYTFTGDIYAAGAFSGRSESGELAVNADPSAKQAPTSAGGPSVATDLSRQTPILDLDLDKHRVELNLKESLDDRSQIYQSARQMAADYPWFGSGPGTFSSLSHIYRASGTQTIAAYAHDDWLETRATFGRVGLGFILLVISLLFVHWFVPGGMKVHWVLGSMLWLSLTGCLVHAKFDFPFQIHSVLFLFLLVSCMAVCVSRRA